MNSVTPIVVNARPPIPFVDLSRALDPIRADIDSAVQRVVDSGWFLRGREVAAFEDEWAAYCGQRFCVTCNSGTDALTLAAMAARLEVAEVQGNTLPLTAIGLMRGGARVEAQDVERDGRLGKLSGASVPVLLYGRLPTSEEKSARLFDAAHAHGWQPPDHAAACWSFYPTKSLGALGDGGAVTTNDEAMAAEMRDLSGRDDQFYQGRQITSRMDEIQAAVLRVKLRHLDRWIAERQAIAARYRTGLPGEVRPVSSSPDDLQHLFVVRYRHRDALMSHLEGRGIGVKVHFATSLHRQDAPWGNSAEAFNGADQWCGSVLTLPCFPGLSDAEVDRVCEEIHAFIGTSDL